MEYGLPVRRVLFVTGAGASTKLGSKGTDIPMMSEWSTTLTDELGPRAKQVGISAAMPGDEFEKALGRYLLFERMLPLVGPYLDVGADGPIGTPAGPQIQGWFSTANAVLLQIRRTVLGNLYENFGRDRIDQDKAIATYGALHRITRAADGNIAMSEGERRLAPECYLAHATTNYDTAIEIAVDDDSHLELLNGFPSRPGMGTPIYLPSTLTSGMADSTARVPVLHLHGAVGWYYTQDRSEVTWQPADRSYDDRQTPALLLPDDQKDPAAFETPAKETWEQFEIVARESTHIFVIGHSLHDAHVISAIKRSGASIAVLVHTHPDKNGKYKLTPTAGSTHARDTLGEVTLIPGAFGQSAQWPDFDTDRYTEWLRTTGRKLNSGP